jgi:hypothetical protein
MRLIICHTSAAEVTKLSSETDVHLGHNYPTHSITVTIITSIVLRIITGQNDVAANFLDLYSRGTRFEFHQE